MAAVPSIGRANRIEGAPAPEADLTRALYEQYASQILRYCLHQLGSREEAEDAVQSTFLNAFRGIKRGIVPELESAWLFSIAHNVCLSRRRSTWRRGRIEAPTDFDVVEEVAPAPSRRADELIGLQDVLEQMPEQQRRAILLREWQGLSYREIADEMELSQSAVETLIFRARRSLAAGLEQPLDELKKRKRMHAGALGNLLSSAQSFLIGGGAAVKVAATVAVVSASTVVATAPVHKHAPIGSHTPAPAVEQARPARSTGGTSGVVTPPAFAGGVQRLVAQAPAGQVMHGPTAPATPLVPPADTTPQDATPPTEPVTTPPSVVITPEPQAPTQSAPPAPPAPAPAAAPGQDRRNDTPAAGNGRGRADAPGQTKKRDDAPAATTPPATTPAGNGNGKDDAPGQTKKNDDPPAVTPPATTPAGNGNGNGAKGKDDAPGQAKKSVTPSVTTPAVTPPATGNGNGAKGKDDAPGQTKKDESTGPTLPTTSPTLGSVVVTSPAASPASFVPAPQGTAEPKNGNGKPKDKDK